LVNEPSACTPTGGTRKRGDGIPKKHIANHFAEWMKRIGVRLRDLESNHEEMKSQLEELEELDSKLEELRAKVDELEGELAVADSRIDDLESEDR
jgi:chromosome segregation ATPase